MIEPRAVDKPGRSRAVVLLPSRPRGRHIESRLRGFGIVGSTNAASAAIDSTPEPGTWIPGPLPERTAVAPPRTQTPDVLPSDPWEMALHRKEPVPVSPALEALRGLATEASVDSFHIHKLLDQRQRETRSGDEEAVAVSLSELSASGYQTLIADLFRREGYEVLTGEGPDADVIDLEATKGGKRWLVNCQLRGVANIDLALLIEMARVVRANKANGAFMIADGEFRSDAHAFAWSNRLILIDRPLLLNMVIELTLEDMRKETMGLRLARLRHPERGHELRHAVLMGGSHGRQSKATA